MYGRRLSVAHRTGAGQCKQLRVEVYEPYQVHSPLFSVPALIDHFAFFNRATLGTNKGFAILYFQPVELTVHTLVVKMPIRMHLIDISVPIVVEQAFFEGCRPFGTVVKVVDAIRECSHFSVFGRRREKEQLIFGFPGSAHIGTLHWLRVVGGLSLEDMTWNVNIYFVFFTICL